MKAETIAKLFLQRDIDNTVFTNNLLSKNTRKFYDGNARLNKYLHIAQNVYLAKYEKPLFDDDIYAYDNGGVVKNVQEQYMRIKSTKNLIDEDVDEEVINYLDKIYIALKNATLDELIDISHEDEEWIKKHNYYEIADQRMQNINNILQYKKQYSDFIKVLDKIC